jgi:hypothetical protein
VLKIVVNVNKKDVVISYTLGRRPLAFAVSWRHSC